MSQSDITDKNKNANSLAQSPIKFTGLKLRKPSDSAGGVTAILSTAKHILEEMDLGRGTTTLLKANQKFGFDCPGCAWPDPKKRSSIGEFCENGAKAIAEETTLKKVTLSFFNKYTIEELGNQSDYWLGKQGRITHPMILKKGRNKYEEISWKEAFDFIALELNSLKNPDEAAFYTSGRTSNEAAFLYQLFVRKFGTNNLPDCSNMCHESSGTGLSETLGIGKGSVTLGDFNHAEVILVMGQNPGTNHPRMLSALEKAKKKGSIIISINPLKESGLVNFTDPKQPLEILKGGTDLCDHFLQVKINGDQALLKSIMCLLFEEEEKAPGKVFDQEFIKTYTDDYESLISDLKNYNVEQLAIQAGIPLPKIKEIAKILSQKRKIIVCWAMGLTQHKNGVANIKEVVNLLLLKGSIGKPGAGTCPVRGHSNVQGDRTMGIWETPPKYLLDNLKSTFSFNPPEKHGYNTVEVIHAMHKEKVAIFFALGGNFLSATPDTEFTAEALQKCNLTVHISTKLNRSHVIHGKNALILPCLGRTEKDLQKEGWQFVSVENSMGVVHKSQGYLSPASPTLLSEPAIIANIATKTFENDSSINWLKLIANYDSIRDLIETVIPGFDNYNQRVRKEDGFELPNCARDKSFKPIGGKAKFSVNPLTNYKLEEGELMMMTIRSHDQFNTTIYGLHDRYRGIYNERRVILMNIADIKKLGLRKEEVVDLTSHFEGEVRMVENFIVVPYEIPEKCAATYFPETNVLVPINHYADKSMTPASKSIIIKVKKKP
ncbi:MAG: FdhF/YdeP family oxidoreductase [Flammeovirgaceae bacterium]|nr:FdhF/YdeP family oxidoreductase [Flammeovirgaceae bacterium]